MSDDLFYPSAPSDYTSTSQSVTFAPNEQTRTVTVPIANDSIYEGSESFSTEISLPIGSTGVNIGDAVATATIQDDDGWLVWLRVSVPCFIPLLNVLSCDYPVQSHILPCEQDRWICYIHYRKDWIHYSKCVS